jgi:hypothetical protein
MKLFDTYQSKKSLRLVIENQKAMITDLTKENASLLRQVKASKTARPAKKAVAKKAVKKAAK